MLLLPSSWQEMLATLPPGEQAELAALLADRGTRTRPGETARDTAF
jgi:hypothetical protein